MRKRSNSDCVNYQSVAKICKNRKKVDPITGEQSDAPDAITRNTFNKRKKVDPFTGKGSEAPNTIPRKEIYRIRPVDPVIGKSTDAENAIPRFVLKK